jgi:FkbM family methyltransferase
VRFWLKRSDRLYIPEIDFSISIKPSDIVIDCGAHIGSITSKLARTRATVYAFEPNPFCYRLLAKRFRFLSNVHLMNAGVMDRPCKLTFRVPRAHETYDAVAAATAGSFEPDALDQGRYEIDETDVECINLIDFLRGLKRRVRFIKLDIEGSEIGILNKMIDTGTINLVDQFAVETHERQIPRLADETAALRERVRQNGLDKKIRFDWQ